MQAGVVASLRGYQEELLEERKRQAGTKERYGIRSLKKLIEDHDADLMRLRARQLDGASVDMAIRNKEERQRQYQDRKKRLADLIEREKSLTISTPAFLGVVRVVPSGAVPDTLRENAESEQAAMEASMSFERQNKRNPTDMSKKVGLGYDIKSTGGSEIRYIEVKGRHGEGDVSLTHNEWFKAKQMGQDYYLYVVWNTGTDSTKDLHPIVIRDPANSLASKQSVDYVVNTEEIKKRRVPA